GDHAPAAEGHDRALERRVRLQADDNLTLLVDVARAVRKNARRHLRYVQNALLAFLREQRRQLLPESLGSLRGSGEKSTVAFVRCVVALDEIAHVDAALPASRHESAPRDC